MDACLNYFCKEICSLIRFCSFQADALSKLEAFTSFNGPDFYGLPRNNSKIKLSKTQWKVPDSYSFSFGEIVPMFAGKTLDWKPSLEWISFLTKLSYFFHFHHFFLWISNAPFNKWKLTIWRLLSFSNMWTSLRLFLTIFYLFGVETV